LSRFTVDDAMTRFIHDKFAKDYFEVLLEPFGTVRSQRRVSSEQYYIDVWFEPIQENLVGLNHTISINWRYTPIH
jgi:hypothetical protein